MTPQALPACLRRVGMGPVAVEQQKIPGAGMEGSAVLLKRHSAIGYIHQKEAVVGFPIQGISGFIDKMSALERVKEELSGRAARRIDEILGFRGNKCFAGFQNITS